MPLDVTCPSCQAEISAPDQARGKAVRCPECSARVPVPAGKVREGAPSKGASPPPKPKSAPKRKEVSKDDDDFLARVDLRKMEDRKANICFKCGTRLLEEQTECPSCGIDQETKQLGMRALKKQRVGPDPDKFWSEAWKNSWKFLGKNPGVVAKAMIFHAATALFLLGFMAFFYWSYNYPPMVFSLTLMAICSLGLIGWQWWFGVEMITLAMDRKDRIKRFNVEFFMCVAMGIKFLIWQIIFFLPLALVNAGIIYMMQQSDQLLTGILIASAIQLPFFVMFPAVMGHMSQPVQWKAWLMPYMMGPVLKTIGPALYVGVIFFVMHIPSIAGNLIVDLIYQKELEQEFKDLARRQVVLRNEEAKREKAGDAASAVEIAAQVKVNIPTIEWKVFIGPAIAFFLTTLYNGWASVFTMRTLANFVYYNQPKLELITREKEKKYVARHRQGQVLENAAAMFVMGVFILELLPAVVLLGIGVYQDKLEEWGLIAGIVAGCQLPLSLVLAGTSVIFMKAQESGTSAYFPIWSTMTACRIAEWPSWIAFLSLYPNPRMMADIATKFGKGSGFKLGVYLAPLVFIPWLACDSSIYYPDGPPLPDEEEEKEEE